MTFIFNRFLMFVLLFRQYNTKYYYEVGLDHTKRQFWFHTPPEIGPDVPYTFGVMGKFYSFKLSFMVALAFISYHCCTSMFTFTSSLKTLDVKKCENCVKINCGKSVSICTMHVHN
jgi:hypothetical protein